MPTANCLPPSHLQNDESLISWNIIPFSQLCCLTYDILPGKCLAILLVVQAAAVVAIVIMKRFHDDWMGKNKPPGSKLATVMHYLKYPLLLWSLDIKLSTNRYADSIKRTTNNLVR